MTRLFLAAAAFTAVAVAVQADGAKKSDGFVQLFNGKDLTGWKPHPADKAVWKVEDGNLTGSAAPGELFSERGDYENFVFRVEAKVNEGGNSGQYFRAQFAKAHPPGYEAQINATHKDPIKTGSLYPAFLKDKKEREEFVKKYCILNKPPAGAGPDEWFTQEVTAIGNHIVIKVNGKTTVDYTDPHNTYTKGHFAIQAHDPKSKVWVRKIEVKELPSGK
jgi:hypothetical protein